MSTSEKADDFLGLRSFNSSWVERRINLAYGTGFITWRMSSFSLFQHSAY